MPNSKSDRPADVSLNLDLIESEGDAKPFVFVAGGERFVVNDIGDLDWQELVTLGEDPIESLQVILGDDYDRFQKVRGVSLRKLNALVQRITEHFGAGDLGEGDGSTGS